MLHYQPHFVTYTRREKNLSLKKYSIPFRKSFSSWRLDVSSLLTSDFVVIEPLLSFKVIEINGEDFLKCTSIG